MKPRITFRVNGTRVGDPARPASIGSADARSAADAARSLIEDTPQRLPTRKAFVPLRVNASALVRDYRDDTDDDNNNNSGAAS